VRKRLTTAEFITRSELKHGHKYDYSRVHYLGVRTKVTIMCPKHGDFRQRPDDHMAGRGCPTCSGNGRVNSSEFIKRAYKIHRGRYSYAQSKVRGIRSKVTISCPKHGKFRQVAETHLAGHGCPKCAFSKGELKVALWLTDKGIPFESQKRIKFKRRLLIFDFYLPDHRAFIGYHGRQHYEAVDHWGGEKRLIQQRVRDVLARLYCAEKGYRYVEIPYTEYNRVGDVLREAIL